jgi:methionine synthase I (cobalamin-dependent)
MQNRGLPPGTSPDSWNLEHPERVLEVARSYVEAGSQIILTNTFRANPLAMPEADADRLRAINRAGVSISRAAAAGHARVAASIGPSGKMLMMGGVSPADLSETFRIQVAALAEESPDALLLETFSDLEEASLGLAEAKKAGLPVIVSFAFDSGKNKDRTMMGATPEQVAARMQAEGADAIGANCGAGVEHFAPVARRLREACDLPVWIKANAGLPETRAGAIVYTSTADQFAGHLPDLLAAGASFVGGCCGTSPEFIAALIRKAKECATS